MNESKRTMKVRVVLTVEVDLDDYALNYGETDRDIIRDDIRQSAADGINAVLANGIVGVEVK